jgi:hypothetical protein
VSHPALRRAPRQLLITSAVVVAAASIVAEGHAAPSPDPAPEPTGTVVDPVEPYAIAADGTRLAWIRDLGKGEQALVVRDSPEAAERIVVPRLPVRARRVALGTDAAGRPTAVLTTGGETDPSYSASAPTSGTLSAVRLDGVGGVRRLAASRAPGAEVAPALRGGELAFARVERIRGVRTMTLRLGSLSSASGRVLWHGSPDRPIVATAIGRDRRVAFTTHSSPGEINVWNLRVARPGAPTRSLERLPSGFNTNAGYGPITTDAAGRTVWVSRWRSNGIGGVLSKHDLITGRRTSARSLDLDLAVPLGTAGTAGIAAYRTGIFATCQSARLEPKRDPCPLTILPAS